MKETRITVDLDKYEEDAVLIALNDMRSMQLQNHESTDFVDGLILKIIHAPMRKVRVRNEPR